MDSRNIRCLTAFLALILSAGPSFPEAPPVPMRSSNLVEYTKCHFEGELTAIVVERAPQLPMYRLVETASGPKSVSVADGYRVILEFPYTAPFVNLKVETSVSGHYSMDKETVLEQMNSIVSGSRGNDFKLDRVKLHDFEVVGVNRSNLEGGTIGLYTFFDDARNIIATAYILNQQPDQRPYHDMLGYRALRDRFLEDFTTCMSDLGRRHS